MVSCFLRNGFTLDWSFLDLVKLIGEEDKKFEPTLSFRTIDEVDSEAFLKLMVEGQVKNTILSHSRERRDTLSNT